MIINQEFLFKNMRKPIIWAATFLLLFKLAILSENSNIATTDPPISDPLIPQSPPTPPPETPPPTPPPETPPTPQPETPPKPPPETPPTPPPETPPPVPPPETPPPAPVLVSAIKVPRRAYSKAFYAEINEITSVRH